MLNKLNNKKPNEDSHKNFQRWCKDDFSASPVHSALATIGRLFLKVIRMDPIYNSDIPTGLVIPPHSREQEHYHPEKKESELIASVLRFDKILRAPNFFFQVGQCIPKSVIFKFFNAMGSAEKINSFVPKMALKSSYSFPYSDSKLTHPPPVDLSHATSSTVSSNVPNRCLPCPPIN